jgi:hypothetical protein
MFRLPRFLDRLTLRISADTKRNVMRIVAVRRGRLHYSYRAVLPMCYEEKCRNDGPHYGYVGATYHPYDVDALVRKISKTYHLVWNQEGTQVDATPHVQQGR